MAKTKVVYLVGACCCGLLSLALIVASFSSEAWVSAVIKPSSQSSDDEGDVSHANHGLFAGTLNRKNFGTTQDFAIYATCLIGENICAWSCMGTEEARQNEVQQLYDTGMGYFQCAPVASTKRDLIQPRTIDSNNFMSAGLWIATIAFISCAVFLNITAFVLNGYNIFYNPIETYASPLAVVISYGVAACFTLLTLILWGAQYGAYTSNNIAIMDTLTNALQSEASLDWSYFILIPAELSQLAAACLVYYRQYIINRQDAEKVLKEDGVNNDANTFMY